MDFLLIVIAILGFVVSIVMLVLAARVTREQHASDARAATLQAMATGSVLFAPAMADDAADSDADLELPHNAVDPAPQDWAIARDAQDLALFEFADEEQADESAEDSPADETSPVAEPDVMPTPAYPFVMTVPAAAGASAAPISFQRSRRRNQL